jgi:hypothetical protein
MSPNRAANAPACPNRAKTRGSVVHCQATAASGTATNPRATNPRTYDELVASKSGNLRRLYTIVCVIILEILQRTAMMDNPNLKPLPSTVLARAIAGDNFGLPAPLAATIRLLTRELRRWVEPAAPNSEAPEPTPSAAPIPASIDALGGTPPRRRVQPRPPSGRCIPHAPPATRSQARPPVRPPLASHRLGFQISSPSHLSQTHAHFVAPP